ncbi:hypothetical protein NQZ68_004527 [Dissostichus eleginoides]|nr:hypothetical protein NQZ68_004527 [Dissostichus eleginoides]
MEAEGSDQAFPAKIKEEHYSVASEPRHILFQLDCLKSQRKEVLDLVMPTKERIEGVERILAIRGEGDPDNQLGDSSARNRRTPDINCDASSIGDLISWSEGKEGWSSGDQQETDVQE